MLRSRLFTTATSLDLSGIITDETGTGSLVFSISPTIITPTFTNLSTFNGQVNITDATASITTSTGALVVLGGLGIGGAANIGGITKVTNNTATSNTTTGAFVVTGGVGIGGGLYAGGQVNLTATADSTDKDSGALVVEGGVGIEKNLYVGGNVNITGSITIPNDSITYAKIQNVSATDRILGRSSAGAGDIEEITCTAAGRALLDDATATDQLTTLGAAADNVVVKLSGDQTVAGAKTFSGITTVSNTTESTTKDTGALVVEGGVGIEKALNVGGNAVINSIHVGTGTAAAPTSNTVVGNGAGATLTSGGTENVCIGRNAGAGLSGSSHNVLVGDGAGQNVTGIGEQTAVGRLALNSLDGGEKNSAFGLNAGVFLDGTRNRNTIIGGQCGVLINAGTNLTSADDTILIGANCRAGENSQTNQIVIATNGRGNGSNTTTIGNSLTTGTYLPNGTLYVQETDNSTSTTTGALVVSGGAGIAGAVNISGGMTVTPNATAPTSNVTIGPSAGAAISGATNNVLIGHGAGDTITGSNGSVAIGQDALGAQVDGAVTISNTVAGTLSTVGSITGVQLVKDSGVGEMAVYPIVTLTVGAGGNVTAIAITTPGSGATVPSGIVFRTDDARIDPAWRGTLAAVSVNTAVGRNALQSNTTGVHNSALGVSALQSNTTGGNNSALGVSALLSNTTGTNNSAVGLSALQNNTTGTNNSAVGVSAGRYRGTGTDTVTVATSSVFIGHQSRAAGDSQTNQVVIGGVDAVGDGSNTTVLGTTATTQARVMGGTFLSTGANGQSTQLGQSTSLLTGLSGATVTATNLIPANCILLGVTARVTTAITGATTFDIGDGTTANRFGDDIAIALNTTANNCIAPALVTAATNVVLTANGSDFTGGAVRLTAHYMTLVAPTS